ncbi:hypothetical protein N7453_003437 [Penicillium expansum]|nr:hypothetical protein N7453_003437 [Penicillium expansum]
MSYEDVLPSTTPKYEFKGIQDCIQILENSEYPGEQDGAYMDSLDAYIIFIIDERSFLDCFENSDERLLRKSWKFYDPSINLLVVRAMTSQIHEAAKRGFEQLFDAWVGFDENYPLRPTGNASFPWTEKRQKLEHDMRFWLTECNDQVNIALTVSVHKRGTISVEEWRAMGANQPPVPRQRITIARDPGPNGSRVQGRLRLRYEDIHLRERPQNATDFTLTTRNMEYIANMVWDIQFRDRA